jgi:hypothetical protein
MSVEVARAVADTVLADRTWWRSGVLMPADVVAADPGQTSCAQAECVVEAREGFTLRVTLRFRQVERRTVHRWLPEAEELRPVGSLEVDGRPLLSGDDAVEHEVTYVVDDRTISGSGPRHAVRIAGTVERDAVRDLAGTLAGAVVRERRDICAMLGLSAYAVPDTPGALRVRVWVENHTDSGAGAGLDALPSAMLAVHLILAAQDGAFVSMADPPAWATEAVEGCANVGLWPVLTGPPGRRDVVLAAPLALGDHPEVPLLGMPPLGMPPLGVPPLGLPPPSAPTGAAPGAAVPHQRTSPPTPPG